MGPTETLAQFVVDTQLRDIPTKALEISKLVILDVFGVTLAASRHAIAWLLDEYLREHGAAPKAGVIGSNAYGFGRHARFCVSFAARNKRLPYLDLARHGPTSNGRSR